MIDFKIGMDLSELSVFGDAEIWYILNRYIWYTTERVLKHHRTRLKSGKNKGKLKSRWRLAHHGLAARIAKMDIPRLREELNRREVRSGRCEPVREAMRDPKTHRKHVEVVTWDVSDPYNPINRDR